jgi:biotin carboxylase
MLLGAGVMQVPGIRIARARGWHVTVVDGNREAMARDMADRFAVVDLKDKEGLLAFARECRADGGLDGIFTAGTDFSSSVAWVAEKMGLPGIPYAAAMRATDKVLMRQAFDAVGAPSPRFAGWAGEGDPAALLGPRLSFPLVVKPVDNMGARGVLRVDDVEALREACHAAIGLSRSSRVIVEEFMEGPELSLDAVVYKGAVTVCGVADRHICFPPAFVEIGHTMPTDLDTATVRRIEAAFVAGIRAIGIDNGAAKGDLKLTPSGPMIGEIAARLSGGYMSGWTFPYSSGVEVTGAALNVAVGLPPGDMAPRFARTCAERGVISIPGIVDRVEGEEEASAVTGMKDLFLRVKPGDETRFPANNVQKCGNVIAVGETRETAIAAARRGVSSLVIRLRPGDPRTSGFLFKETGNDAFAGIGPTTRRSIADLPVFRGDPARVDPTATILVEALEGMDGEESLDWHGARFADAARRALSKGRAALVPRGSKAPFALSGAFWRALVRGSTQGGLYVLDSVRPAAEEHRLEGFLGEA